MKAWVLHNKNDLRLEDVHNPISKKDERLVNVKYAGICSSDILRVFGTGAYHYPIILGHEFSGITTDGKRVGVFPLLPCFACESCKLGIYETCSNYSYIGSRCNGAFAEYVSVPEWNLIDIPDELSLLTAAMLEPAAVALHAVKRLNLDNVSSTAVIGNGVIGRLIAKWLTIFGVDKVDLLGRNDKQSLPYYDTCIEAVGNLESLRHCIEIVRPNGQIVLVGNPSPDFNLAQNLYWQVLRKQIVVYGSWNSSYRSDWEQVIKCVDNLGLDELISHKFAFNELSKAFDIVHGNKEKHCKVMVEI